MALCYRLTDCIPVLGCHTVTMAYLIDMMNEWILFQLLAAVIR
jgi:hypothetical protein